VFCSYLFTWCNPCHNFLNIQSYVDNVTVLFSMDTSSSTNAPGVQIPNYPLATGDLSRSIEHSGSVTSTSSEEAGEYYAMAMAHVVAADMVQAYAIIVVPLTQPAADEILDFTFVAAAKAMFVQLHERLQPMRTYVNNVHRNLPESAHKTAFCNRQIGIYSPLYGVIIPDIYGN
jgi:hypothetical protein